MEHDDDGVAVIERQDDSNPFAPKGGALQAPNSAALAMQQREVTEVQSAMIIARRFPRNEIEAMDRILNACTRPTLAAQAVYEYARGGSAVTGPSIRLAEVLAQCWGHIDCGVRELDQRDGVSTVQAYAWDLQTNYRDSKNFQVKHWRDTKKGGYKIEDSRDVYELVANLAARRKRACILAVIPGDVVEAALAACEKTMLQKAEVTPERIAEVIEVFAEFGVTKEMIEKRIQRRMEAMTPGQLVNLRKIKNSLADGMSKPHEYFEMDAQTVPATPPVQKTTGASALRAGAAKAAAKVAPDAKTKADAQAPSYAELASVINKATDVSGIDLALSMLSHLPEEQQAELRELAEQRRLDLDDVK